MWGKVKVGGMPMWGMVSKVEDCPCGAGSLKAEGYPGGAGACDGGAPGSASARR